MTGEPAQELGVQPGWVLFSVGGELAPPDVNQITKLVTKVCIGKGDEGGCLRWRRWGGAA